MYLWKRKYGFLLMFPEVEIGQSISSFVRKSRNFQYIFLKKNTVRESRQEASLSPAPDVLWNPRGRYPHAPKVFFLKTNHDCPAPTPALPYIPCSRGTLESSVHAQIALFRDGDEEAPIYCRFFRKELPPYPVLLPFLLSGDSPQILPFP